MVTCFRYVFGFFTSCRKNETTGPNKEPSKEELQKTFFNTSTTNDAEIKELATNIQKQKSLLNSLPDFVRKNGIPKWDKVLYKTKQAGAAQQDVKSSSSSLKTNTVSSNGATKGVFLIPLQDENSKEIKSYITAYKHNDSLYTYRLYNKDSLNNVHPTTNALRNNLLNTQAVFGYFEKTINNTDSVNVLSPVKATIKNTKIHFDDPTSTNSVNNNSVKTLGADDGCLMSFAIIIDYSLTIYSDGSYTESLSVTLLIDISCGGGDGSPGGLDPSGPDNGNNWWNYGTGWPWNNPGGPYYSDPNYYPGSYGYNNSNWNWWWTSNPGLTPIQSFVYTLSPSELNFWNDPSNFLIVYYLTNRLNQENLSSDVQDFVKWAIDYLYTNPSVTINEFMNEFLTPSEGTDGDYNDTFWNDPNLIVPRQNLPTYQDFFNAYPKSLSSPQVYQLIGGSIYANHLSGNPSYQNACALRVSRALNYSGINIPVYKDPVTGKQLTEKGSDGKNYFLGAKDLNKWLNKTFGPSTYHFTKADGGLNGRNFPTLLNNAKGIYSMVSDNPHWASGHADIIDKTTFSTFYRGCDSGCHFDGPVDFIDVWLLQ